jgi:beta-ureidopropionase
VPGQTTDKLSQVARELEVAIVAPLFEKAAGSEYYNCAVLITASGTIAGTYRKNSIPLSGLEEWSSREKFYFKPGTSGFPVFQLSNQLRVGILICYDRHFPEAARELALHGAELVVIPTTTGGPSRAWWELELQAHAIANTYYVAAVNRVGHDANEPSRPLYFGASFICSYDGSILAQASETSEEIVLADIDPPEIYERRNRLGWFRDRRPELYADLTH